MINPNGHTILEYTVYGADLRELIEKAKKFPEALYGPVPFEYAQAAPIYVEESRVSSPSNDVRVVTWAMPCQAQAKL
jgi:hypothetical protein